MEIEESNECSVDSAKARNYCKRTCNHCISNAVPEKGKKCRITSLLCNFVRLFFMVDAICKVWHSYQLYTYSYLFGSVWICIGIVPGIGH